MGKRPRPPLSGQLVEVTCRTLQSRLLLTPGCEVNATIKGVLGRAQRLFDMPICVIVFLANHFHLLVIPDSAKQLADFMAYVNSNLARKIGRLQGWEGKFWGRPYSSILVSDEVKVQVGRLRYLLANGVKENLVLRPQDWPGVHCVDELVQGSRVVRGGEWRDQTAEYEARRRGRKVGRLEFVESEEIFLSPLPSLEVQTPEQRRRLVQRLVKEIEHEARQRHEREGTAPLGVERVKRQDPQQRPLETKRSPAPWFHAASRQVYRQMQEAYREFHAAYREAAAKLARGVLDVRFPPGCFPPRRPFVPEIPPGAA